MSSLLTRKRGAGISKVDTVAPVDSLSLEGAVNASQTGNTIYYCGSVAGPFKFGNEAVNTSASVAKVDTSGPQVTAIESRRGSGSAGNGQLEVGDKLILAFNQSLAVASVPTSVTGATEAKPMTGNVTLTIRGFTKGALDTGSGGYVLLPLTTTTFAATVALANGGGNAAAVGLTTNANFKLF